ncbi:hypothetical protein G6F43_006805 [Rhizopus delemar]|nr:hypothetical protein G6F43_006805 [Rhizopus delemar]
MTSDICRFESASQLHDHGDGHVHSHAGHDAHEHGHTHEQMDSPGFYQDRPKAIYDKRDWSERAFTVGIGGPVGSGKTALMLALCQRLRETYSIAAVTNDIFTKEDTEFLVRHAALPEERIAAIETGGCPHAAIREDVSANLNALETLHSKFNTQLLLIESGGDNLAANYSRELADYIIYVIDVAGGDKVPRKGGPGITQSDLLIVNKTDLAHIVGADLEVMARDAKKMRGNGPTVFAQVKNGVGMDEIISLILGEWHASGAIFAAIGAAYIGYKVFTLLKTLFDVYVAPGISLKKFGAGQGAWAVITGATDGIGKEFALQLAKKKFNVFLISRTASKLEAVAEEIASQYGVETKCFAMDFTKGNPEDFSKVGEILNSIRVGVLVNNVGVNHEIPTPFEEEDETIINNIVEVNIKGLMKMTKLVLPQMKTNRNGLIFNLGSFAGLVPTPYLSVYSAGKAFLSTWSQALGTEVAKDGIVVEHVNTYFVVSAMSKIRKPTILIPTAKNYVASVLSKVGVACGANVPFTSTPYPTQGIVNWVINNVFSHHFWVKHNDSIQKDIRKRALRKREREQAAALKTQ